MLSRTPHILTNANLDPFGSYLNELKGSSTLVTAGQMRAARALLGISQAELARRAGVSVPTIKRCESDAENVPTVSAETQEKICAILKTEGVEFTNGNYPGVRMRRRE